MQNCQLKLKCQNYNKMINNYTNMKMNTSKLLTSSVCCVLLDSERSLVQTEL